MYFKDESQAIDWWKYSPNSDEWEIIHEGERREGGHRYELIYSKFDEQRKIYSKYIMCFSKKEAVLLAQKIKETNLNYTTNIKRLY